MSFSLFFLGAHTLWISAQDKERFLNLCLRYSISFRDFRLDEEENLTLQCSSAVARRLEKRCREAGIEIVTLATWGIPAWLWRYRRRAGIFVGVVLAAALFVLSEQFVWDVRVRGNNTMTSSEVLAELKSCGFGVGSYIPKFRAGELENRVLLASDRISWISVNLEGTVATVQVIERVKKPPEEDRTKPANLVAALDGQIELVQLYRGNCVVKVGQGVRAGDLLVSGLYDSETEGYRYTRAAGQILARTQHDFHIEIPLSYEEKIYGEAKCNEITLNFFDFSLKIFKRTGNEGQTCDIIERETGFDAMGGHALPIRLTQKKCLPYVLREQSRTAEEAGRLAYAELERELATFSENSQLLGKRIVMTMTDTHLILDCTVTCIEDIAVQAEFEVIE